MNQNALDPLKQIIREHRALANAQPGRTSNDCVLGDCLAVLGLTCGGDELRSELDSLERRGLLDVQRRPDLLVLTMTRRGTEAAEGTILVEGVQRPGPGCPY